MRSVQLIVLLLTLVAIGCVAALFWTDADKETPLLVAATATAFIAAFLSDTVLSRPDAEVRAR